MTDFTLSTLSDRTRGLASFSREAMASLGLAPGDTVALEAARRTHARAVPAVLAQDMVACDAETVTNLGVAEGERVRVVPTPLEPLDGVIMEVVEGAAPTPTDLEDLLFDRALTTGDVLAADVARGSATLRVLSTAPGPAGLVTGATTLSVRSSPDPAMGYEGLAGLSKQIAQVHEMIALPLSRPDLFRRLGVSPPRGVLFCGAPGSGKTLLARSVAARTKAAFFQIDAPEIVSKHYGDSEAALRKVFAAAEKAQPAIIFIDEIDAIAPRRGELSGEKQVERRIVAQLLTLMDGLSDRGRVVVMAATNLPDALDPALRRPGRFDREVRFSTPDPDERRAILALHLKDAPLGADVDLSAVAAGAHGYVGADLAALAREAAMAALARAVDEAGSEDAVSGEALHVTQSDLLTALERTAPSALRAEETGTRPVAWSRIGGLAEAKAALERAILWPRREAAAMRALGLRAPRGVLLTGAPGSGKTLAARALATEGAMNFIAVRPATLLSQFLGEAERAVARLFERARDSAPCLLFFDEFDTLAPRRGGKDAVFDRIVAQLLVELDGASVETGVSVLAATNRADAIDQALLRPGRFDLLVPFDLPDVEARSEILAIHVSGRPVEPALDLATLAKATEGFSGADLAAVVDLAAWRALSRMVSTAPTGTAKSPDALIGAADLHAAVADHRAARRLARSDFTVSRTDA